jgi:Tfp pilus assembly protein PilV
MEVDSTINAMKTSVSSSKGISLIDGLIAMAFLSVAMLGTVKLLVTITDYNLAANQSATATALAQDKIEELKNSPYASLVNSTDTRSIYTRAWTTVVDTPEVGMKTIQVTVSWTWKDRLRDVVLTTAVTGNP